MNILHTCQLLLQYSGMLGCFSLVRKVLSSYWHSGSAHFMSLLHALCMQQVFIIRMYIPLLGVVGCLTIRCVLPFLLPTHPPPSSRSMTFYVTDQMYVHPQLNRFSKNCGQVSFELYHKNVAGQENFTPSLPLQFLMTAVVKIQSYLQHTQILHGNLIFHISCRKSQDTKFM